MVNWFANRFKHNRDTTNNRIISDDNRSEPIKFNFEHGDCKDIYTSFEIAYIRKEIADKFMEEVENGAIDPKNGKLFKENEKKCEAIYDRLADDYRDDYVYTEEFTKGICSNTKRYWSKCASLSSNQYYIYDIKYIIDILTAPDIIKEILIKENDAINDK